MFVLLNILQIFLFGLVLLTIASASVNKLFPFGPNVGDTSAEKIDDGSSGPIALDVKVEFLRKTYQQLWVNSNGMISMERELSTYNPCKSLDSTIAMIGAFISDVNIVNGGDIYFRQTYQSDVLEKIENEIRRAFPDKEYFKISWAFVVTWSNVSFFGSDDCVNSTKTNSTDSNVDSIRNTYQTVLATNTKDTYVIFVYQKLKWTSGTASGGNCSGLDGNAARAGFDVGDGETFFQLPGSCEDKILNIADSSNTGSPGRWVFSVAREFEEPSPMETPSVVAPRAEIPLRLNQPKMPRGQLRILKGKLNLK